MRFPLSALLFASSAGLNPSQDSSDALWDMMLHPPLEKVVNGKATPAQYHELLMQQLANRNGPVRLPNPLKYPIRSAPTPQWPPPQHTPQPGQIPNQALSGYPIGMGSPPYQGQMGLPPISPPGSGSLWGTSKDRKSDKKEGREKERRQLSPAERAALAIPNMADEVRDMIMSNFWQLDVGGDFYPIRFHVQRCIERNVDRNKEMRKAVRPISRALKRILDYGRLPLELVEDFIRDDLLVAYKTILIPSDFGLQAMALLERQFQTCADQEAALHEGRGAKRRFEWSQSPEK